MEEVIAIAGDSLDRVWPDLTIVLDVDLATLRPDGQPDVGSDGARKGDDYHQRFGRVSGKHPEAGRITAW